METLGWTDRFEMSIELARLPVKAVPPRRIVAPHRGFRFLVSRRNYSRHPPGALLPHLPPTIRSAGSVKKETRARRSDLAQNRREGRAARARSLRSPLTSGRKIYYID